VLRPLLLSVARGEVFGIVGHSGAGKSTLRRMIKRLESARAGQMRRAARTSPHRTWPPCARCIGASALFSSTSTCGPRARWPATCAVAGAGRRADRAHPRTCGRIARTRGAGRPGLVLPCAAVRRTEAARGHRPHIGHRTGHPAVRRGHQRTRPANHRLGAATIGAAEPQAGSGHRADHRRDGRGAARLREVGGLDAAARARSGGSCADRRQRCARCRAPGQQGRAVRAQAGRRTDPPGSEGLHREEKRWRGVVRVPKWPPCGHGPAFKWRSA